MSKETKTMNPFRTSTSAALLVGVCLFVVALIPASASAAYGEPFEIINFDGGAFDESATPEHQAGSHPFSASVEFDFNRKPDNSPSHFPKPLGTVKDVYLDLPAGLVGNPQAVPTCPADGIFVPSIPNNRNFCPPNTQVGVVELRSNITNSFLPIYNVEPPPGRPAQFKFIPANVPIIIDGKVRTGGDYGVSTAAVNAPQTVVILGVKATFWGVPAAPAHDAERGLSANGGLTGEACAELFISCSNVGAPEKTPFVSLPTSCNGPVDTDITITVWEKEEDTGTFTEPSNEGCGALDFSPTLSARPTTNVADSASGLDVELHIPQNEDPLGLAEAHLKDSQVTLPKEMSLNPSAANGLDSCSANEVELEDDDEDQEADCPEGSKVGKVKVETPLLDHPLEGGVYLAEPFENPFDSLLALYILVDDPETGITVKIAGKVEVGGGEDVNPALPPLAEGQLRAVFEENPQLPFEDLKLNFFGGSHGSLRTPATCGTYTTTSELTPWSEPEGATVTWNDSYAIEQAASGGSCPATDADRPKAPSFDAGTVSPVAAARTPMVINLRRAAGGQQFDAVTLNPPQGLVAKLAGVSYCSDSALAAAAAKTGKQEQADASCPAASLVGSVTAGAGAGPAPYYAPGKAYLTGPYKGAPLSLAIVTPAVAGPFDLGTIVVRTALFVDRRTTRVTAVSDPIPASLKGIPLDVRSVQVRIDKPDFAINPTSCNAMSFDGELRTTLGQTTPLQSRFQVGECDRLKFQPKLSLKLEGGTRRTKHPALTAVLRMPEGSANLAAISVALPHSEFLDQSHIRTICTRVQFAADQCPKAAIYGKAKVTTPLLDYVLTGDVYLRSSSNPLPDLVVDLRGPAHQPIKLESAGRVDSINGGIRNTFDFVPDAPFTKLVLEMQGGKKGLLVNSTNICRKTHRATAKYTAQNGDTLTLRPALKADCGKNGKKPKKNKRKSKK